ncbi:MAG: hypothetical protein J6X78_03150 [Treponema sp.]|nr:hypothetical protein [Treponema sp.]
MEKKKSELELYKIAIEGYQKHWDHYNHWMNMYAIFNGALFVGLYNIIKESKEELIIFQLCICVLGCISSWFWLFSARGFYRWLISWIKVVKKHEKYFIDDILAISDTEFKYKKMYVYNLFIKAGNEKCFELKPFSSQKLTQWFAGSVAIVWSIIFVLFNIQRLYELGILTVITFSIVLISVVVAGGFWLGRESSLDVSHIVI